MASPAPIDLTNPLSPPASSSETVERLALLAPELRAIVQAEIAAGNVIASVSEGRPIKGALNVVLAHPFLTPPAPATRNLRYRVLQLPEWWSAEYTTLVPPHTLACRAAGDNPAS